MHRNFNDLPPEDKEAVFDFLSISEFGNAIVNREWYGFFNSISFRKIFNELNKISDEDFENSRIPLEKLKWLMQKGMLTAQTSEQKRKMLITIAKQKERVGLSFISAMIYQKPECVFLHDYYLYVESFCDPFCIALEAIKLPLKNIFHDSKLMVLFLVLEILLGKNWYQYKVNLDLLNIIFEPNLVINFKDNLLYLNFDKNWLAAIKPQINENVMTLARMQQQFSHSLIFQEQIRLMLKQFGKLHYLQTEPESKTFRSRP